MCAWEYKITPLSHTTNPGYIYGLGYLPIFLVMAIMIWSGWKDINEDLWVIKMRREREFQLNEEIRALQEKPETGKLPPTEIVSLPPVGGRSEGAVV